MFVNCSPASDNVPETLSSLEYARRVKQVKNNASKQVETKEIRALKAQLEALKGKS